MPTRRSRRALLEAAAGLGGLAGLGGMAGGLAGLVALAGTAGCAAADPSGAGGCRVFVGSEDGRLRAWWLDAAGGSLRPQGVVAEVAGVAGISGALGPARPRWLLADARRGLLHVAGDPSGAPGQVQSWALDGPEAPLRLRATAPSGGAGATHLAADADGRTLLVANFGAGTVASLALDAAGAVAAGAAPVSLVAHQGSGPHRRQAGARAHGVLLAPGGRHVLAADLGADRVFVHGFDPVSRQLLQPGATPTPTSTSTSASASASAHWAAPPGSGPRQLLAAPGGRQLVLVNELSADLTLLDWSPATGRLQTRQVLPLGDPARRGEGRSAAGAVWLADGRHLVVLDRGAASLERHALAPDGCGLQLQQRLPAGGEQPWALALAPGGRWLLVALARSQALALFAVSPGDGRLTDTGVRAAVPAPLSVLCV